MTFTAFIDSTLYVSTNVLILNDKTTLSLQANTLHILHNERLLWVITIINSILSMGLVAKESNGIFLTTQLL